MIMGDDAFKHWFRDKLMKIRLALLQMTLTAKKVPTTMTGPAKSDLVACVG
jgi:hypothetical protein